MALTTYILLFRGVGGPVKLPVAELRAALTKAGFKDATTYINSGNALVRSSLSREKTLAKVADFCKKKFKYERPIFIPTASALGIDMVHFGVVVVVNLMVGLITPPYGLLLFVVSNVARAGLLPIMRDILPFLLSMLASLLIITFFPDLVLWLPRMLGYAG